jgi:hypothetical protein
MIVDSSGRYLPQSVHDHESTTVARGGGGLRGARVVGVLEGPNGVGVHAAPDGWERSRAKGSGGGSAAGRRAPGGRERRRAGGLRGNGGRRLG